ncbi:unnamed protein product [Moneuplotes crassus]|uniref:Uncharacterized protein n=1 Tax=Euplotes crassus TaxID=5936 RepID=A0AAD2D3C9_EUPCR|nr:unnamed protein product [Moneuplotes crassus]
MKSIVKKMTPCGTIPIHESAYNIKCRRILLSVYGQAEIAWISSRIVIYILLYHQQKVHSKELKLYVSFWHQLLPKFYHTLKCEYEEYKSLGLKFKAGLRN